MARLLMAQPVIPPVETQHLADDHLIFNEMDKSDIRPAILGVYYLRRPQMANKHYIPALDGLRTLAVVLVVVHHLSYRAMPAGHIGVDVFFVLSGFLITGVLLREYETTGRVSLLAFYARRALRLMPALVLVTACTLVAGLALGDPGVTQGDPWSKQWGSAAFAVTYLMDFVRSLSTYSEHSPIGHTWSLAVEEHFYLVWPLLLAGSFALQAAWRAPAMLAIALTCTVWRCWLVFHGALPDRTYYGFDTRADQLLVGCALAAWLAYGPGVRASAQLARLWPAALGGLLLISAIGDGSEHAWWNALGPVLVAVLSAMLILELVQHRDGIATQVASTPLMVALGKISYGIYLWHYPILLHARLLSSSKLVAFSAVAASVAVAGLSYRYVEQPFLRLKRRFERGGEEGAPLGSPVGGTSPLTTRSAGINTRIYNRKI